MQYISFKYISENRNNYHHHLFGIGATNTRDIKDLPKISQTLSGKAKLGAHVYLTPKLKSSHLHLLYCL